MEEIAERARKLQPWLLIVDRTVGGPYENYITPEQEIPDRPVAVPWESCITMGTQFSFKYEDEYKPIRTLIHLLIEIVCKGGNLALNVGSQPDGRLPETAVKRMKEMGVWLRQYGEAIYGTRICAHYKTGQFAFTRKGETVYAFLLYETENSEVKPKVVIPYREKINRISLVGTNAILRFERSSGGVEVEIPAEYIKGTAPIAHVFKIE